MNPTLRKNTWFRYEVKLQDGFRATMLHNQKLGFKEMIFTTVIGNRLNWPGEDSVSSKAFGYGGKSYSLFFFKTYEQNIDADLVKAFAEIDRFK